jgi:pimeloyl-ACP methyl ester carboxylesterase
MKKPILLMLPGLDGTGNLLKKTSIIFDKFFDTRIISYPLNEKLTYKELLIFVESQLPSKSDFYILAESFGGPLAIEIATKYPNRVKSLFLSATFSSNPLLMMYADKLLPFLTFSSTKYIPDFILDYIFLSGLGTKILLNELKNTLNDLNQEVIKFRIKEVLLLKNNINMKNLTMPVTYFQGKNDNLILQHNFNNLKRVIPHIKKVEIKSGHMVLQTCPEQCLEEIILTIESKK